MKQFKSLFVALAFCISCPAGFVLAQQAKSIDSTQLLNDIRILSSVEFGGRRPGTPEHQKSVDLITARFAKLGLKHFGDSYQSDFEVRTRRDTLMGKNLIAYIPGKSKKTIVISGHYDHIGVRNDNLHPGADDNASGAAALMAIAAYYADKIPHYTLVFASWDAEEMGLQGARYFVANPLVPLEDIVLNINMDMVSRNDQNRLVAAGTYHSPHLKPYIESTKNELIKLVMGYDVPGTGRDDWTNQSDQGAFHAKGIPFIYFGVEDHPDYHTPRDTFENIQPRFFYQSVLTILEVIKRIDQDAAL